ncbi:MAG: SIMPL domain-containing protein [Microgenomates group bacterium]
MKNTIVGLVLFFIALFVYTKFAGPIPFSITNVTSNKSEAFTVTGEGKISVKPDIATVNVGVQAQGTTVEEVQNNLNKNINAITAAIKTAGIDEKDIKTSNYNLSPTYDYSSSMQRITGYQASSNLTIKVRKIETANSVVDAATQAGANTIGGISFDVDDKTKAENEARKLAVADAKAKAELAAETTGFTLGKIINYQESTNNNRMMPMYAKAEIATDAGAGAPTQLSLGSTDIELTVTLSYEVK